MSAGPPHDRVRATVLVKVPPELAFRLFTEEIDRWWRRGVRYRVAGQARGALHLEPRIGGRLFESFATPGGEQLFEAGRVTVWQPPERLAFTWRAVNFASGEQTLVEVSFEPSASGTQVTLVHSGLAALRPDHPVRHGLAPSAFLRMLGLWWGDLLTSLREHALAS